MKEEEKFSSEKIFEMMKMCTNKIEEITDIFATEFPEKGILDSLVIIIAATSFISERYIQQLVKQTFKDKVLPEEKEKILYQITMDSLLEKAEKLKEMYTSN